MDRRGLPTEPLPLGRETSGDRVERDGVYFWLLRRTFPEESIMSVDKIEDQQIIRDLGDGLVLRRATRRDSEALVSFNARIHGNFEKEERDERVGAWTRDLMERPHPTFDVGDFTIVEDTHRGEIVSSLNLISQIWTYGGIPFGVGRPELVGTHPEYRNRGLVRAQFETIHRWSAERGEKVQAITGIPYYYRLFGYEMALELGGGRLGYLPHIPEIEDDQADHSDQYRIRPASESDIPFIGRLYEQAGQRYLINCVRDEELWRYEISGKSPNSVSRAEIRVVESHEGKAVGCLAHPIQNWGPTLAATYYEIVPGVPWLEPTYHVIRYLAETGKAYAETAGSGPDFGAFAFWLGTEHPVYTVIPDRLPRVRDPYAWYIRVPDVPDFIRHIAPVLQDRLANSPMSGFSGELQITFYREGLRLVFEAGEIEQAEPWRPTPVAISGDAAFPGLTFLQLLFGYRGLEELQYSFPDMRVTNDRAQALLGALFPKQISSVSPVA